MIKLAFLDYSNSLSFFQNDSVNGLKVKQTDISEIIQYSDGYSVKIKNSVGSELVVTQTGHLTQLSVSYTLQIINRKQYEINISIPIMPLPPTTMKICMIQYELFRVIIKMIDNRELFMTNKLLNVHQEPQIAEDIALDVTRTRSKLYQKQVFLILFFQQCLQGKFIEFCTSPDVNAFNKITHDHDLVQYFESLVLYKIASQTCYALNSYQQGYCEIINFVMHQQYSRFVLENNTSLIEFIDSTAQIAYCVIHAASPAIDCFIQDLSDEIGLELNQMVMQMIQKQDQQISLIFQKDCQNGGTPLVFHLLPLIYCMFSRSEAKAQVMEYWIQLFGNPSAENMLSLCCNVICRRKHELLAGQNYDEIDVATVMSKLAQLQV